MGNTSILSKKGDLDRGKNVNFEQVGISGNLNKGSHAVVRFLEKEKSMVHANKKNVVFKFSQSSSMQDYQLCDTPIILNKQGKPPDKKI